MAKLTSREVYGLKKRLAYMAHTLTGTLIHISNAGGGELGYTCGTNTIYIAFEHSYYDGLSKIGVYRFIRGVFFHEVLHFLQTDFSVYRSTIQSTSQYAQSIMSEIYNIIEDSAIENFAPLYAGDALVQDLNYHNAIIYKNSPPINYSNDPFIQFINASIQYGDAGLLKGTFSSDTARRCFLQCVPIMDKAVEEFDNRRRSKYAKEIFNIAKPLWESRAKNNEKMQKLIDELMRSLEKNGKQLASSRRSSESPIESLSPESKTPDSSRSKRRKVTFKKVSAEEYKKALEEAKDGVDDNPADDIEILIPDEAVDIDPKEKKDKSECGVDGKKNESDDKDDDAHTEASSAPSPKENTEPDSETNVSDKQNTKSTSEDSVASKSDETASKFDESTSGAPEAKNNSKTSKGSESQESESPSSIPPTPVDADGTEDDYSEEDVAASIESEAFMDEKTAQDILDEMAESESKIKKSEIEEDAEMSAPLDISVGSGYQNVCGKKKCYNTKQKIRLTDEMALSNAYDAIVQPMRGGINKTARQLERIFKNSADGKAYRTSGKVDIDRLCDGRKTARIFTKRKTSTKSDMHVCFAIDCSGSMTGTSIKQARIASIALAEVFGKLHIPVSMFGFTADDITTENPHHIHFIDGANTKRDRLRLLGIKAMANNFDGYSIRYASELLKKKQAVHKLLFVISDGAPACNAYSYINGVMDTKLAIKEASKNAVVFGILVGRGSSELHKEMYGYNFMQIKRPEDLFNGLARCITKQVKKW